MKQTKTVLASTLLAATLATPAIAQDTHQGRLEVSITYASAWIGSTWESETVNPPGEPSDTLAYCTPQGREAFGNFQGFFCDRRRFDGVQGDAAWHLRGPWALAASVSAQFGSATFTDSFDEDGVFKTSVVGTEERLYRALAGVQLGSWHGDARVRPFARTLVGVVRHTATFRQTLTPSEPGFDAEANGTGLTADLGAGIDVRLARRVAVRLAADYSVEAGPDRDLAGAGIGVPITIQGRTGHHWTVRAGLTVR